MTPQRKLKKKATAAEQKIATDLGGKRIFNSGAGMEKGDARVPHRYLSGERSTLYAYRIESKYTETWRYTLNAQDWANIANAAATAGEFPVFHIQINSDYLPEKAELVIIPTHLFEELAGHPPENPGAEYANIRSVTLSARMWNTKRGPGVPGLTDNVHMLLAKPTPRRGDVVLLDYHDFKHLAARADESCA
jgi:hypothetical protein